MTMSVGQSIIMIAAIILATVLTRFLPFIIFGGGRPIPDFVNYLGKVLPFAVTGMLVVYSLKDAPFNAWHGLPDFICAALSDCVFSPLRSASAVPANGSSSS